MSAQVYELPRVAPPLDQEQRFAWLLAARSAARKALDVALSVPRKAAAYIAHLVRRAHMSGSVSWLRRAAARLARPLTNVLGRLGKTGMAAAAVSVITNPTCRRLISNAGSAVGRAFSWIAKKAYSGVDRILRLFGRPGKKAADLLFSGVVSLGGRIAQVAAPVVHRVARFTDPDAAHVRVISGLARSFVLHRVLKAVISNPYVSALVETVVIPVLVGSRMGRWITEQLRMLKGRFISLREQAGSQSGNGYGGPNMAPEGDDTGEALTEAVGPPPMDAATNRAERRAVHRLATGMDSFSSYPAPKARRKH